MREEENQIFKKFLINTQKHFHVLQKVDYSL